MKSKKVKRKEKEPQMRLSLTNTMVWDYRVYYPTLAETLCCVLLAFSAGGLTGYLFYGGLAKDAYNNPTVWTVILNAVAIMLGGFTAAVLYLPIYAEGRREKKKKILKEQFVDLMDSLATSLMAGANMAQSFENSRKDLQVQYSEESDIIKELDVILSGMPNNIAIEKLLADLGERSGIEDIKSFANVFDICYRKGGNIKEVIQNTSMVLGQKAEIEQEIETRLAANKNEQVVMSIMPVVLVALIKGTNPSFAKNFATPAGVMASTAAVICFIVSFYVSKKILDIKI